MAAKRKSNKTRNTSTSFSVLNKRQRDNLQSVLLVLTLIALLAVVVVLSYSKVAAFISPATTTTVSPGFFDPVVNAVSSGVSTLVKWIYASVGTFLFLVVTYITYKWFLYSPSNKEFFKENKSDNSELRQKKKALRYISSYHWGKTTFLQRIRLSVKLFQLWGIQRYIRSADETTKEGKQEKKDKQREEEEAISSIYELIDAERYGGDMMEVEREERRAPTLLARFKDIFNEDRRWFTFNIRRLFNNTKDFYTEAKLTVDGEELALKHFVKDREMFRMIEDIEFAFGREFNAGAARRAYEAIKRSRGYNVDAVINQDALVKKYVTMKEED